MRTIRCKRRSLVGARAALCDLASWELGVSGRQIAEVVGGRESMVSRAVAAARDRKERPLHEYTELLDPCQKESQIARNVPV